jgi:ribose-phosphate pyrophosphokinase
MLKRIDPDDVRFFSGSSHLDLAQKITNYLDIPLIKTSFSRFSNDNLFIQLGATVRSRAVYVIQSLTPPVSEHLMELFIMLDIARSAGASEVHAVIPYFSYARSDKKDAPRLSITARLIADLLVASGATHVMTMTLHSPQVHGFFSIPTDPLTARNLFTSYLKDQAQSSGKPFDPDQVVVVAPDFGRAGSAGRLAASLGLHAISAEKTRLTDTEVFINDLIMRQVEGFKKAIIYDDEIATGGSVITLCNLLVRSGVEEIVLTCTHGLFISKALDRILAIPQVKEIITTDTVHIPPEKRRPQLTILSVAPVIGDAIWKNYNRLSIGSLFSYGNDDEE